MIFPCGKQAISWFHTVLSRDKGIVITSLFKTMRTIELALLCTCSLQFPQNLVITLSTHHDLTVDVLNIHILSAVGIGSHKTCLIGDSGLDIIDGGGRGRLLQR